MRNTVISRITESARKRKDIFLITGDAGFGVLDEFKKSFPSRFLNLGVAEQNMIGFASGLALTGYKVFVYNIVPFVLFRCYEQVRNDICYQRLPVTLIGIGSGLTYSPQGVTHYAVEDIAVARTLPNLVILSPSDPVEADACAQYALTCNKPVYIRVAKSNEPVFHKQALKPSEIEKPIVMREGEKVAVLFHGSISSEVIKAYELCRKTAARFISVPMIQPLNFKVLKSLLRGIKTIITVEEHFTDGGLGSVIGEWIIREGLNLKLKKLGIPNEFVHEIRTTEGMREHYGINARALCRAIERF